VVFEIGVSIHLPARKVEQESTASIGREAAGDTRTVVLLTGKPPGFLPCFQWIPVVSGSRVL
jgi:hypothetical protein